MKATSGTPRRMGPVATVLEPSERPEVDQAGVGLYRAVHRDTVADALQDLRVRRVSAVLLSASRCREMELPRTMRVVREFPRVPALVLVTRHSEPSPADILALGNCGVRQLVDVRTPTGWNRLREALTADATRERDAQMMTGLAADLHGAPGDFIRFIEALFIDHRGPRTVRSLSTGLGVLPSTLMSRFFRAGVPAPKKYLAFAGLVRAARLFENPGLSVADVSYHLDYSSPQSFGRHIFTYLGISSGEFRRNYDGAKMMQRFRDELIISYRDRIARMSPLVMRPRGARPRWRALLH